MSDLAYAGTNGADQSAPAAAPKKPLDWEKTIESMLGELTFVDGHLQSLRFTLEMLRHMEGGERIKALESPILRRPNCSISLPARNSR